MALALGVWFPLSPAAAGEFQLQPVGVFQHAAAVDRGAEILAYDAASRRLLVSNGTASSIDILDIADAGAPRLVGQIRIDGDPTHVGCQRGLVAVSVAARPRTDPGQVMFFDVEGRPRGSVLVDPLPDMLIFAADGSQLLVANEGEPADDYRLDPEGAVTIIDLGEANATNDLSSSAVTRVGFDPRLHPSGQTVRVSGPGASPAQDYEPEYIGLSPDGVFALVTLQENNAFARLDLRTRQITEIVPLGQKPFEDSGLDASDRDQGIQIKPWPVKGLYQPDGTVGFQTSDGVFFITANEGDQRSYGEFADARRVSELTLDPDRFPDAAALQQESALGRLMVSEVDADTDGDGDADQLLAFGARSFAIWDAHGQLVYDSGDQIEQYLARHWPLLFNSEHDADSFDSRSDDRGPEPEGLAVGRIGDRVLAFLGLERVSGIVVIDITSPSEPRLCTVYHGSAVTSSASPHPAEDQAPEGILFIPGVDSPTGKPLLAVAFEVSGTVRLYHMDGGDER